MPSITWSEAVDQALCFGWIDSTSKPIDDEKFMQFFCKRKPKSVWSKINKEKVLRLTEAGLMTQAGFESIETAKLNGSWNILDEVEELTIPQDLTDELKMKPVAEEFFLSLSKSVRKSILQWLVLAKRPETRQNRITEIAELAAQKLKPKQFR
ncbi:YdeI/OmpD-associated family protein [Runella aurantiaca]|nr:YdeI/OmpD-associated family protein [Runella aurantiaca]